MNQFFIEASQIYDNTITILGQDVNHIKNVLRMKIGDEISLINSEDNKEYRCGIIEFQDCSIICQVHFIKEDGMELSSRVYLFQGIPKADKMEWIIQKAVELGVYEIIPVAAKRCIVKLDDKKERTKTQRWQGISEAAAKQSKRRIIPKIKEVMTFKEALAYCRDFEKKLIPYEMAEDIGCTKKELQKLEKNQKIAVFIGPEGGFEPSEIQDAINTQVIPITLGKRILRTETAGMTILSWIMLQLEE